MGKYESELYLVGVLPTGEQFRYVVKVIHCQQIITGDPNIDDALPIYFFASPIVSMLYAGKWFQVTIENKLKFLPYASPMNTHFNRHCLLLSLLSLGVFLGSLFFAITTLEKRIAFAKTKVQFLTGVEFKKAKKNKKASTFWDKGVQNYQKAEKISGYYPKIYDGFHYAGNCLHSLGRNKDALEAYNQALKYHPYSITDLAARATVAAQSSTYDLAIQSLELCQQIYPFSWKIAYNLADAYKKTGKPKHALPYYLLAWKQNPNNFPIFLQVVNTYAVLGNIKEAKRITAQMASKKLRPKYRKILKSLQKDLARIKTSQGS